jgi:hypothetical protein
MKHAEVEREHRENERDEPEPEEDVDLEHVAESYMAELPRALAPELLVGFVGGLLEQAHRSCVD